MTHLFNKNRAFSNIQRKSKPSLWTCLATHRLVKDTHKFSQECCFLTELNDCTKTLYQKTFSLEDLINSIKNHNKTITNSKRETKSIYQKIIQEG